MLDIVESQAVSGLEGSRRTDFVADRFPALVLNADFQPLDLAPLSVWSCEKAFRKILQEKVVVVDTYGVTMRSPSMSYDPASVVALRRYVRPPERVAFTRYNLFCRDNWTCQYCGEAFDAKHLTFDHVVPRALGGGTNWKNIVASCMPCNGRKGKRTDMKPRRHPFEPSRSQLNAIKRKMPVGHLHETWRDYLYWDVGLVSDQGSQSLQ